MGLKQPTHVSFFRAAYLCFLALLAPDRFDKIDREDRERLDRAPDLEYNRRIDPVRQGFFGSLKAVLWSIVAGVIVGLVCRWFIASPQVPAALLASFGAAILLWATLAIAGYDIQTWSNATLTERVSQWIFRGLYFIGTTCLVIAALLTAY